MKAPSAATRLPSDPCIPPLREVLTASFESGGTVAPNLPARRAPGAEPGEGRLVGWLLVRRSARSFSLSLSVRRSPIPRAGAPGADILGDTGGDERPNGLGGEGGIWGLAGEDVLYGGGGRDALFGGPGEDFVESEDGASVYAQCGAGTDVASVEAGDFVAGDSETVYPR